MCLLRYYQLDQCSRLLGKQRNPVRCGKFSANVTKRRSRSCPEASVGYGPGAERY